MSNFYAEEVAPQEDIPLVVVVGYYVAPSVVSESLGYKCFWIPYVALLGIICVLGLATLIRLLTVSHLVLRYQLRATIMCGLFILQSSLLATYIFLGDSIFESFFADLFMYWGCVALHPTDPNPPCTEASADQYPLAVVVALVMYSIAMWYVIVAYMSYGKTTEFYKTLIKERRVISVLPSGSASVR